MPCPYNRKAVMDMNIILVSSDGSGGKIRVAMDLRNRTAIKEMKKLISTGRRRNAMSKVLEKGSFIEAFADNEIPDVPSELILTETSAHWCFLKM